MNSKKILLGISGVYFIAGAGLFVWFAPFRRFFEILWFDAATSVTFEQIRIVSAASILLMAFGIAGTHFVRNSARSNSIAVWRLPFVVLFAAGVAWGWLGASILWSLRKLMTSSQVAPGDPTDVMILPNQLCGGLMAFAGVLFLLNSFRLKATDVQPCELSSRARVMNALALVAGVSFIGWLGLSAYLQISIVTWMQTQTNVIKPAELASRMQLPPLTVIAAGVSLCGYSLLAFFSDVFAWRSMKLLDAER